MGSQIENTSNKVPIPHFTWNNYNWDAEIQLPSWQGFKPRQGPAGVIRDEKWAKDTVTLTVNHVEGEIVQTLRLEDAHAFQLLMEHEAAIHDVVLKAIFAIYPEQRESFIEDYDNDPELIEMVPQIEQPEDLKTLIGLSALHLVDVVKDGLSYLGFEFECTWDEEHGLGVLMHGDRVVKVGQADVSFTEWIARRDS